MKARKNGEKNSAPMKRENSADLGGLVGVEAEQTERMAQLLRGEQVDDVDEVRAGQGGQVRVTERPAEKSFRLTALAWRARAQPKHEPTIWRRRSREGNGDGRSLRWRSRTWP